MPQSNTPPQILPNTTQQEPQQKQHPILTQTPPTRIDTTPLPKTNLNPISPNQLPHLIRPRPPTETNTNTLSPPNLNP